MTISDPFDALNATKKEIAQKSMAIHSINITVSKREYFALHLACAQLQAENIIKFDEVIQVTDGFIKKLKETEKNA